jgi:hypothetical protein
VRRIPLALFVLAAACWAEETEPSGVCLVHEGITAPSDQSEPPVSLNYHADRPLEFVSIFFLGDDETRDHRCTVVRDGTNFTVAASYERNTQKWGDSDFFDRFEIRCTIDPLPAGTYTFTHAGETRTFTLPASVPAPCLWFRP